MASSFSRIGPVSIYQRLGTGCPPNPQSPPSVPGAVFPGLHGNPGSRHKQRYFHHLHCLLVPDRDTPKPGWIGILAGSSVGQNAVQESAQSRSNPWMRGTLTSTNSGRNPGGQVDQLRSDLPGKIPAGLPCPLILLVSSFFSIVSGDPSRLETVDD